MSRRRAPKVLDQRAAEKLLTERGWTRTIGGKHSVEMEKPGHRPITLPRHHGRDYGPGLRAEILRSAGIGDEEDG